MNKTQNFVSRPILEVAIIEMCRIRKGDGFLPSEVLKWLFPESWEHFLEDIYIAMANMQKKGEIEVLKNGVEVFAEGFFDSELRIRPKS